MREIPNEARVVVLGGAGGMGRVAVETVSDFTDLGELIVADLDPTAAESVVAKHADAAKSRMRAMAVDVMDPTALRAVLAEADVVLNTTGPFYRFGVPVLRTAIEAGCHYLDICDDWEPTIEMLALDQEASSRGVLAVIGMGASPGLSNLMARMACDRLEKVEDLYTAWPVDAGDGLEDSTLDEEAARTTGVSAALVHWMQQISGRIQVVEGGELVSRQPVAPVALDFPGAGSGTGYTVGHPEPITLRERMSVHGASANLMLLKSRTAAFLQVLREEIDAGRLSIEEAGAQVFSPSMGRQAKALARSMRCPDAGSLPPFFALARGTRDGSPATVGVHVTSLPRGMDRVTGIPLALGLRQLLDGHLDGTGVHPPETAIEPKSLFEALAQSCDPPKTSADDLLVVTEG